MAAAGRGRGRFPCPTVGRKGMEGRGGAPPQYIFPFLCPRSASTGRSPSPPPSPVRPSCARIRHAVMSGAEEWGGQARRPLRSLHISNGRRDGGSDRFFSSFSPRKSFGCLLWSPSPSVLFFFNCSTRRDGRTDRRFSLCSDFSHTFFLPPAPLHNELTPTTHISTCLSFVEAPTSRQP